jgi:hypothetical protein
MDHKKSFVHELLPGEACYSNADDECRRVQFYTVQYNIKVLFVEAAALHEHFLDRFCMLLYKKAPTLSSSCNQLHEATL